MTETENPNAEDTAPGEAGPPAPAPVHAPSSGPPPPPTPVRTLLAAAGQEAETPSAVRSAVPEPEPRATLEVDGRTWTVGEVGRSLGGPSAAPVPLLLVGFFQDPDGEDHQREALVVGRALRDLSEDQLEAALRASREPPPAGLRKPLFPEIVTKGDKRDG